MKQHYFDVPFAFAGDVTAIPDPLQVGGSVSMTEGWNFNYQRDLSTDPAALPIDRSTTNWLLLQISTALQALQQAGVPEFILASQNGGAAFSYGKGASVLWSASGNAPFVKYVSLTAGNTNTPSASDPQGLTTGWQIEVDPIATAAQASAGTDDASIMTPLKVAQQTALRALLAGNASQVFNVATATAASHAVPFSMLTGVVGTARNVSAQQGTAAATLPITTGEIDVETSGGLRYMIPSLNVTFTGTNTGANGMDTGGLPASGYVGIYAIWNPTTNTGAVLGVNASTTLPEIYGGANMPAGYTASALLFVVPTQAASLIDVCFVQGRKTSTLARSIFSVSSVSGTPVLTNNLVIPLNAKRFSGGMSVSNTGTQSGTLILTAAVAPICAKTLTAALNGTTSLVPYENLEVTIPQRVFVSGSSTGGTATFAATATSWEI